MINESGWVGKTKEWKDKKRKKGKAEEVEEEDEEVEEEKEKENVFEGTVLCTLCIDYIGIIVR